MIARRTVMAMFGVACASVAFADVAVWTNVLSTGTANMQWGILHNWTNAYGETLSVVPTNATCDVLLPSLPVDNSGGSDGQWRTIYTGEFSGTSGDVYIDYPAVNPVIGSIGPVEGVWDTWRWTIENASFKSQYQKPDFKRVFSVANPDAFDGYWAVGNCKTIFDLPATATHVPVMSSLSARCRPYVRVPDADTTAAINAVHKEGTISKIGAGELRVATTMGTGTRFIVEDGTLTFEGSDDDDFEALLKTAALRLDATRTDTLLKETRTIEGVEYTCVTNWLDANGNGNNAYWWNYASTGAYWYKFTNPPFVSPVKSPTDLPLVDFGSRFAQNYAYGPSNCFLRLTREITDPRAVFYAVQTPGGAAGCTILGDGDNVMGFVSEGGLFCSYNAGRVARTGDIMINGEPMSYPSATALRFSTLTNLNVISDATRPGAKVGLLGSDRYYVSRSGGSRLGEVLIFTNELTRAQRVRVAQYLTRRWVTGEQDAPDANAVIINSAGAAVGVAEGRKARVDELAAPLGTVTKTGGGTLEIGHMEPRTATIRVEGGGVAFGGGETLTTDAPAADPYIWLDANDFSAGKMTTSTFDGYDATYVSEWRDHRADVDMTAISVSNTPPRMPFMVDDMGNGMKGVSLGIGTSSSTSKTQSFIILPNWGEDGTYGMGNTVHSSDTYAGFIVCRFNVANDGYNIFGSSNMDMMRTNKRLLHFDYTALHSPAAFWSINGVAVDPFEDYGERLSQTNDLVLVAFRSPVGLTVNSIAKDRKDPKNYTYNCGNLTVCEFITYHRQLTDGEFRATEAYLMKKWMNADHPAASADVTLCQMDVASDTQAAICTEGTLDIGLLSGGSGVVKAGSGSATVRTMDMDAAAAGLTVEEGSLSVGISLAARPLFHFDASVSNSFTTYEGEDGKTYVTCWNDISSNKLYGCSMYRNSNPDYSKYAGKFVMTDPTLAKATMPDGVERTAVDFGGYRNTATQQPASDDASSIYFSRTVNGGGKPEAVTKVREIYVVQKIIPRLHDGSAQMGAHVIGNLAGGAPLAANSTIYMRGDSRMFSTKYTSHFVQEGYLATNRVPMTASTTLNDGWLLMSVGATGYTRVDSIMQDRDCNAGGACVAEMIAFDFELTAAERTALEQSLMRKWGIGSEAAPTFGTAAVNVAAGTSLDVGDCNLTAGALSGGGTVTATALAVAANAGLYFTYRSPSDVDHLAVNGPLSLAGGATVHVAVAESAEVEAGEWPLLSATGGITGLDLASMTLDSGFAPSKWIARLFVREGALWLRVQIKGTAILFR